MSEAQKLKISKGDWSFWPELFVVAGSFCQHSKNCTFYPFWIDFICHLLNGIGCRPLLLSQFHKFVLQTPSKRLQMNSGVCFVRTWCSLISFLTFCFCRRNQIFSSIIGVTVVSESLKHLHHFKITHKSSQELSSFWTNQNPGCIWLQSAEHMDPSRVRPPLPLLSRSLFVLPPRCGAICFSSKVELFPLLLQKVEHWHRNEVGIFLQPEPKWELLWFKRRLVRV